MANRLKITLTEFEVLLAIAQYVKREKGISFASGKLGYHNDYADDPGFYTFEGKLVEPVVK